LNFANGIVGSGELTSPSPKRTQASFRALPDGAAGHCDSDIEGEEENRKDRQDIETTGNIWNKPSNEIVKRNQSPGPQDFTGQQGRKQAPPG